MSDMSAREIRNNPLQCLDQLHEEMTEQLIRMKEIKEKISEIEEITRDQAIDLLLDLADIDMALALNLQRSMELSMVLLATNKVLRREGELH